MRAAPWAGILLALVPFPAAPAARAEERILVSVSNADQSADALFSLSPDGSGEKKRLFDFSGHPKVKGGRILSPRVGPGGGTILFHSDNAYVYTPLGRNLFRIASDGSWWDQITPGPRSGLWGRAGPFGAVTGTVRRRNGRPWSASAVFLEGCDLVYTKPDGTFRFDRVPGGARWIVAYRTGSTVFDAMAIRVEPGAEIKVDLVPRTGSRSNLEQPVRFGDRIYHCLRPHRIQWTTLDLSGYTTVYTATGIGAGITDVDGFDVGPRTGRLAILDYQSGCPTNRGLYVADRDGKGVELLVDMKAELNWGWGGAQEVFWSPDESRLALKGQYGRNVYLAVFHASDGRFLGSVGFPDANYTLYNVKLHGWSPDGNWLLSSAWPPGQPGQGLLSKVRVSAAGVPDAGSARPLLQGVCVSGATWGNLGPPAKKPADGTSR